MLHVQSFATAVELTALFSALHVAVDKVHVLQYSGAGHDTKASLPESGHVPVLLST